jgi:hypothetical protein
MQKHTELEALMAEEDDDLAIVVETDDDFGGDTKAHYGVPSEPKRPAMPTSPPPVASARLPAAPTPPPSLSVAEAFQGMLWAAFAAGAAAGAAIKQMTGDAIVFDREVDDVVLRGAFESWYGREVSG